jgi:hypothetical protein
MMLLHNACGKFRNCLCSAHGLGNSVKWRKKSFSFTSFRNLPTNLLICEGWSRKKNESGANLRDNGERDDESESHN